MTSRQLLLVDSDGEQIGVEVAGSGPAVVLLHGSGGNRATWWQQVVDLAVDYTVVVVEARGSGRSTDRADSTGPVAGTRDLEAVRAHLGLDAWHLVGHSLGGWTALRYAATHPTRTLSAVIVSSVGGVFPPAAEAEWQRFTTDLASRPWPGQLELARPPSLTPEFCDSHPERAYLYQLVAGLNPAPSMTSPAVQIRDHDLTEAERAQLTMALSFVVGSRDEIAAPVAVQDAAAAVGAHYVEIDGGGHLPFWEDPTGFGTLLRELLDR